MYNNMSLHNQNLCMCMKAKTVGCQEAVAYFHVTIIGANLEESENTFLLLLQKKLKRLILSPTDLKQNVPAVWKWLDPEIWLLRKALPNFQSCTKPF